MKKLFTTLFLLFLITIIYLYSDSIVNYVMYNFVYAEDLVYEEANIYKRNYDFKFVQRTEDFEPNSKQDILNIVYTALDNGWDDFTFFCPKEYEECLNEVETITNDSTLISNINNYVGTYNSYNQVTVNMNNFGRVNIVVDHLYSEGDIEKLSEKVDSIYNNLITNSMTDTDKIKVIHDYLINNTIYDEDRSLEIKAGNITSLKHPSNMAYGPLFTGKAICGGYTDAMALFLDKMGIINYKVSSANHIWNLAYLDNEWKHLDLTWDDPVVNTGENALLDTFFLISTEELFNKDITEHKFNEEIFIEAN